MVVGTIVASGYPDAPVGGSFGSNGCPKNAECKGGGSTNVKTGDAFYANQQRLADDANQQNRENGVSDEERDAFFEQIKDGNSANRSETKTQNIRLPDAGGSDTNLQVEIGKTLTVIMNSQGIDAKAAIKAGGMKVVVGKNGVLSLNGVPTNLQAIGISRDALKVMNFKLKAGKSGSLDWQVTAKIFGGGFNVKLKGSFELNPANGILGPSLRRMKETSAGEL